MSALGANTMTEKKSNLPPGVPHHDICDTLIVNAITSGDTDRAMMIYNETYAFEIRKMNTDPHYKPSLNKCTT